MIDFSETEKLEIERYSTCLCFTELSLVDRLPISFLATKLYSIYKSEE